MKRNNIICDKCSRPISRSNFKRHNNCCDGIISSDPTKSDINPPPNRRRYNWIKIQERYDDGMSYRELSEKYGMTQWTLAKAKQRGALKTRSKSEGVQVSLRTYGYQGKMSIVARKQLSVRMSKNNPGGKCKWYNVAGKKVQGTWERDFALFCELNAIKWSRCKYWEYEMNNKTCRYTPDFYLPDYDIYLELKGYWWGNDKQKMDAVISQHPDKNIQIVEKELYEKILRGEQVW